MRAMISSGVDMPKLLKEYNVSPVITKIELEFKQELTYPDEVRIESTMKFDGKLKGLHEQFAYRQSDGKVVAICTAHWFFIDIGKRKPVLLHSIGIAPTESSERA